jgi:multicomponent Na+:H+ antiporter subunit E
MFFLFYTAWFIFNGRVTVETAVIGFLICLFLYLFSVKYLGYSREREKRVIKKLPSIIKYIIVLFFSIIQSNISVMKVIIFGKKEKSVTVKFTTDLKRDSSRCVLANSITLTPGTYTVGLKDGYFIVHGLLPEFCKDIEKSDFVKQLKKMEEQE